MSSPSSEDGEGPFQQPNLETLLTHLVAAKRSLSSIDQAWKANEIVTTARAALEESVTLSSRATFLHQGVEDQLQLLNDVRTEARDVAQSGREEFSAVLKDLDAVDGQLKQTLKLLQETTVEPSFRPPGEARKSLHDFVDERGVEDVHSLLKDAIDSYNAAQADLDASNVAFDGDSQLIRSALDKYRISGKKGLITSRSISTSSMSASRSGVPTPTLIPEELFSLESHAQEIAHLLEGLVRHFDLCVTAVKHTEGGGAEALRITGDLPSGVDGVRLGSDGHEINPNGPPEPLTDSEYQEMLAVLMKDASEAEEVVLEIQDRGAEMETTLDRILEQRDCLAAACESTTDVVHRLSKFSATKLPVYIAEIHKFTRIWAEERERMQSGMADLSDLRWLYAGFLDAYDGLILEVARRKAVRSAAEKVLRDARAKLDKLHDDDVRSREAFRVEQGDYLPSDIWPGLGSTPMRVEFRRIFDAREDKGPEHPEHQDETAGGSQHEGEGAKDLPLTGSQGHEMDYATGGGNSIPDLPKHIIEKALARRKARIKGTRFPPK